MGHGTWDMVWARLSARVCSARVAGHGRGYGMVSARSRGRGPLRGDGGAMRASHHSLLPPKKKRVLCYCLIFKGGYMSELIDIEKDVLMPELPKRGAVYPYERMEVGDSFFIRDDRKNVIINVCNRNRKAALKNNATYTAKKVDGGVRVWRVK